MILLKVSTHPKFFSAGDSIQFLFLNYFLLPYPFIFIFFISLFFLIYIIYPVVSFYIHCGVLSDCYFDLYLLSPADVATLSSENFMVFHYL